MLRQQERGDVTSLPGMLRAMLHQQKPLRIRPKGRLSVQNYSSYPLFLIWDQGLRAHGKQRSAMMHTKNEEREMVKQEKCNGVLYYTIRASGDYAVTHPVALK